jgi:poly(A) polymerase
VTAPDDIFQRLAGLAEWSRPVAEAFAEAGYSLFAVGGSVRDALLGVTKDDFEIDYTTNARPDDIARLMKPLCTGLWEQGREFGTIGGILRATGLKAEITTFRSEAYVDHSRKPAVEWGDSLEADLSRRDFTINALALDVIGLQGHQGDQSVMNYLYDFFGGMADLQNRRLRAPIDPVVLFTDDPLRMLRAARFAARFHLGIDPPLEAAASALAEKIAIVSEERIQAELDLLMMTEFPSVGLDFLVRTGLANHFFPELPKLELEQDPIHRHKDVLKHTWAVVDKTSPRLVLRLAALFHDIGKPPTRDITPDGVTFRFHEVVGAKMTRKRMTALKYSKQMIDDVSTLVELHLRFHTYKLGWSDAAVRRYVRDAGHLLEDLNELTRCDCTTRNARKAAELSKRMDDLEVRIDELRRQEDIDNQRPALDGQEVMALLELAPSREVGVALDFLLALRHAEGEVSKAEATVRLREAWSMRQLVVDVLRPLRCGHIGKGLYVLLGEADEDEIDAALAHDVLVPWHNEGRCEQELYEDEFDD